MSICPLRLGCHGFTMHRSGAKDPELGEPHDPLAVSYTPKPCSRFKHPLETLNAWSNRKVRGSRGVSSPLPRAKKFQGLYGPFRDRVLVTVGATTEKIQEIREKPFPNLTTSGHVESENPRHDSSYRCAGSMMANFHMGQPQSFSRSLPALRR